MKSDIHPQVHEKCVVTCTTCNAEFHIPGTIEEAKVETCRNCHPIYTGKKQKETKGGRIDRFRKRMAASQQKQDK